MAREKKSLFEWLTGSSGDSDDFGFDDLESGTSYARSGTSKEKHLSSSSSPAHSSTSSISPSDSDVELSVDVYQTPTHIVIKAMIAGVRAEDLDVSITRDMVTIRGKREKVVESSAGEFFYQELYWGSFSRTIVLPQEVDIEGAEASEKHGLLIVRLPKLDKGRQTKLKVRSN